MSDYTLKRGLSGAERLRILGEAMWPSTFDFLTKAGLKPGMKVLDAGCGVGVVSREIFALTGHCHGVDIDQEFVSLANDGNEETDLTYAVSDIFELPDIEFYDVIYSRYLLSHLGNPKAALEKFQRLLKPGGVALVEDIDFPGHVHYPPNPAFEKYLELYQTVVNSRGGNPQLGPQLFSLAHEAGFESSDIDLVVALQTKGRGKRVAELTLEHISAALCSSKLIDKMGLQELLSQLQAFRADNSSFMSIAPTYQLMASKSALEVS